MQINEAPEAFILWSVVFGLLATGSKGQINPTRLQNWLCVLYHNPKHKPLIYSPFFNFLIFLYSISGTLNSWHKRQTPCDDISEVISYPVALIYKGVKCLMMQKLLWKSNRSLNFIIMNKKCFKAVKPLTASRWRDHDPPMSLNVQPERAPCANVNVNDVCRLLDK